MLVLTAAVAPAVALAVATPVSPARGARVDNKHLVFVWTLPANERSDAIYISKSRVTTQPGRFRRGDLVDAATFAREDVVRYTPPRPLYEGRYWWLVQTSDLTTSQVFYSSPAGFTIPAATSLLGVRLTHIPRRLTIDIRWTTNTRRLLAEQRVSNGTTVLFSGHQLRTYPPVGGVRHTFFTWQVQDFVRPGTLLRLDTKVTGAGHAEKATRYFRAP